MDDASYMNYKRFDNKVVVRIDKGEEIVDQLKTINVEHKALGGHLTQALVSATFEGIIDIIEGQVTREFDDEVGLNLLKL